MRPLLERRAEACLRYARAARSWSSPLLDNRLKDLSVDRLLNIIVHAACRQRSIVWHGMGRHRDDGHMRATARFLGTEGSRRFIAIHFWHLTIHEDQVIGNVGEGLKRLDRWPTASTRQRVFLTSGWRLSD